MSSSLDDPLAREHERLRAEAAAGRKAFRNSPLATLGAVVMEAVKLATAMKADGASNEMRFRVIETTLREFWPKAREWKFLCEQCSDTGLVIRRDVMNRLGCKVNEGVPCVCSHGSRFTGRPKGSGDDFTNAGKVKKPQRGFTRFGQ